MLGQEQAAEDAYRLAMQQSKGLAPATWSKACASVKNLTTEELKEMEAAATFLTYGRGTFSAPFLMIKLVAVFRFAPTGQGSSSVQF